MQTNLPTDLTAATDEELAEVEAALIAEFDDLLDSGSTDVVLMTEIADAVEAVRTESRAREEQAEAAAAAVAALADRVRPTVEEIEDEIDEATETELVAEDDTENTDTEERDLVTASGADRPTPKAPSARAVRSRSTTSPEAPAPKPGALIAAAADVPGYYGGQTIGKLDLAKAMHAKARTLSNGSGYIPVASIALPIEHKVGADIAQTTEILAQVTAPSALTAAGWCAPSQNLYDLLGIEGGDGLIDLPTVQVTRGGLNVPDFISIGEATAALWTWTEADADDPEATKPCLMIPCPGFTDYRLIAEGLCVNNGNLTDRAFPELTARFVELTLNAHLHRLSGAIIADIVAGATAVTMAAVSSSAAGSILHAVDVQVADYRSQYLMPVGSILETVFPLWTKELIRADLAMRTGVNLTAVDDAMIDEHFAIRKVRAQFLHDYQPLYSVAPATDFPTSLQFLIYPAGGYVRGDGGTIDLGVVRDSVLNATNDYTAAWTEQMYLVAQMGPAARKVTVNYAVDGVTGCCPSPNPPEVVA